MVDVLIISMLMPSAASTSNIWAAMPGVRLLEAQPLPGTAACAALEPYLESQTPAETVRC